MLRPRMLVAYLVAGAGLATALWLPSQRDTANAADTPVSPLAFSDDFNGSAGSPADSSRWRAESTGRDRRGPVRFTDSTRNASQDGEGHLTITVRPEAADNRRCDDRCRRHTSARLTTAGTFSQLYGRFEARMKLPRENALQPRFALVGEAADGADAGEIAVVEHTRNKVNTVYAALRGPGFSGGDALRRSRTDDATYWHDFHTYAVQWSPDEIVWSVDGVEFHRATPESLDGRPWVFDQPAHLVLEVGVGGDPGDVREETEFSRTLTVDYVRVTEEGVELPPTADPSDPPTTTPPSDDPPTTTPPSDDPPVTTPPVTTPPVTTPPVTTPPVTTPPVTTPPVTTPPATTPPPAPKAWKPFTIYLARQTVTYLGKQYQVRQTHTSLPGWQPPNVPALFQPL